MDDSEYMRLALEEAARGLGHTSPNPAVGALIVKQGKILSRGYHHRAGMPHAEIEALARTRSAKGATLYVTLEPCSTHGRTPPCVEAILAAGIRRVVVGATDPNPSHAGRGLEILRRAGVEVVAGILEKECAELNAAFNKWITTGIPLVIAKAGMSLDGRIARPPGEGQWITSPASREHAQKLRAEVDAILIGAGTLRHDNPHLTVRGIPGARQPWRVVLTRSGNLPAGAHLFTDAYKERTLVFKNRSLSSVLRLLGKRQVTSVLIEGGMNLLGQALDKQLIDRAHLYFAPLLLGGPTIAFGGRGVGKSESGARIVDPSYERIGDDLHCCGTVVYPERVANPA